MESEKIILESLKNLEENFAVSTSFGVQSAVMLHMITQIKPNIPVIFIDTNYLFPETYEFKDFLVKKLNLNLITYSSKITKKEQENRYGRLWEQGLSGLEKYNYINKIEPMERALRELNIKTWFSGIRKQQSDTRNKKNFFEKKNEITKVYPILEFTDKEIYEYLKKHNLPYHPLYEKGYLTVGDKQLTKSIHEVNNIEELRFNGLKRECGLHE